MGGYILGKSKEVYVSLVYMDAQTWGVSHISGYPRIVQGSLGILGVCGY